MGSWQQMKTKKFEESGEERKTFKVWKLKENNMKARFQERVKKLVNVDGPST